MQESTQSTFTLENFTFWQGETLSLQVQSLLLKIISSTKNVIKCEVSASINWEQYNQIQQASWFNLKPEICNNNSDEKFKSDRPIQIQITLKPDLLANFPNFRAFYTHFSELRSTVLEKGYNADSLLQEENWYCLSVKQTQNYGEVGYETLWKYFDLATLNDPEKSEVQVADGIVDFVKDAMEQDLTKLTEEMTTNFFNDLTQDITKGFGNLLKDEEDEDVSFLSKVIQFFEEDDWSFLRLEGETSLRLAFAGNNGQWNCYAKVNEEQQTFLFYSICPLTIPEDKRQAAAEFITRANYGMILGNFELDYNDGEIRYKTSIDVEGDRLSQPLIKNLVYRNVMMMDEYLPGIVAVVEGNQLPQEAIAQVENV